MEEKLIPGPGGDPARHGWPCAPASQTRATVWSGRQVAARTGDAMDDRRQTMVRTEVAWTVDGVNELRRELAVARTCDHGWEPTRADLQGAGRRSSPMAATSADLSSGVVAAGCLDVVC